MGVVAAHCERGPLDQDTEFKEHRLHLAFSEAEPVLGSVGSRSRAGGG